jgi:hypothetical protein
MTDPKGTTPLFPLGQVVATPGTLEALVEANQSAFDLLQQHATGDWGDLEEEDKQENEFSIDKHLRIFSRYVLGTQVILYVITEADRSVTTLLLASEY